MLQEAKHIMKTAIDNPESDTSEAMQFFSGVNEFRLKKHRQKILNKGLNFLQNELHRQQEKITILEECLPMADL